MTAGLAATLCLFSGTTLIVGGVYVLSGLGWALIAAAGPFLLLAAVLLRGLRRG